MILIGYYLGARIGDSSQMRWSCVDFEASTITFRQQKKKQGSKAKPVTTVLMPELRDYLMTQRQARKVGEFVLPNLAKEPVTTREICLYERPWVEEEPNWAPSSFVERIRRWFSDTANGSLHRSDQPLEPLLFQSPYKLVLPRDSL